MSKLEQFHKNIEDEFSAKGINCTLTTISRAKNPSPKVVISVCAFRLQDPYKDETVYKNGLLTLLDNMDKLYPGVVLLLYHDESVLKKDNSWKFIIDKAKQKNFVELVQYDFKDFKMKDKPFHEGLFGTIIRFFVLFDFKYNIYPIAINDIDMTLEQLQSNLKEIKHGINLIKQGRGRILFSAYEYQSYLRKPRLLMTDITEELGFPMRMMVQPSVCIDKIPKDLIIDFILCIRSNCELYKKWSEGVISESSGRKYKSNSNKSVEINKGIETTKGVLIFGADEFLLNSIVLKNLLQNKQSFIVNYELPSMTHYHYALFIMFKKRMLPVYIMYDMYYHILGKKIHTVSEVYECFNKIDKVIYNMNDINNRVILTPESKQIYKKIYEFLKPRTKLVLSLPQLLPAEKQMFEFLRDSKTYDDIIIGKNFYTVKFESKNKYGLIRL